MGKGMKEIFEERGREKERKEEEEND